MIGVGRHGGRYARHLCEDFPSVRLAGIWRRNRDEAARQAVEFGCAAYDDVSGLIGSKDVDALVVVVPPTMHREIVCAALECGKPLLLEKPAAVNLEDGAAMIEAMRRNSVPVMVAQTLRFNGVVRALLAERESIGRIHAVRISQRFEPSRPGWIDDPGVAGGGVMLHTGVHSFDLLRHLTGLEATAVSCAISRVGTARTEDNFVATVRLSDGVALASIAGSRATASRTGPIELAGEFGQLVGDHVQNSAFLVRGTSVVPLPLPAAVPTVRETLAAFIDALRRQVPMPIPLEEGLRSIAIVRACYEAAQLGRSVAVPTAF